MKPSNQKTSFDYFAKKFFNIKRQPYQRDIIKLIESGKTKRLKIIPYRPTCGLKHKPLIESIMDQEIALAKEYSADTAMMQTRSYRPNVIIIDDIEAPFRYPIDVPLLQHEKAIVMVKATTL